MNRTEQDALLEQLGSPSFRSTRNALPTLLSNKHDGWAVIGLDDDMQKDIDPETLKEVDFRQRTITIRLMETKGEYLDYCGDPVRRA